MCTGGDNRNTDGIRCIVLPNGRVAGGPKYVTIVEACPRNGGSIHFDERQHLQHAFDAWNQFTARLFS